jgi:hypothetical protein
MGYNPANPVLDVFEGLYKVHRDWVIQSPPGMAETLSSLLKPTGSTFPHEYQDLTGNEFIQIDQNPKDKENWNKILIRPKAL